MADTGKELLYRIEGSGWSVRDIPERCRPREEMERVGAEHVSDAVLLAIILRSGTQGTNVVALAEGLLRHFGSLTALAGSSVQELARVRGMGRVKAQTILAALELGRRLSREALPARICVRTPEDAARVLRETACRQEREVFWVLHLDAKNRLKRDAEAISHGLLDASLVHPREVFRDAIRSATAAVVLVHNHPSGDPAPSAEDVRITRQLVQAGKIVDIKVLDHIVLGRRTDGQARDFVSMREEGMAGFGS